MSDTATPDLKKRIDTIEGGYELFLSYAAKGQRADPKTGGELRRCIEEMDSALDTYYEMAGWDKSTGNPTQEKMAELGLEWVNAESA